MSKQSSQSKHFRRFRRKLLTPRFMVWSAIVLVSNLLGMICVISVDVPSMWHLCVFTLGISGIALSMHLRGVQKVELYPERVVLVSIPQKVEIPYNSIERLHYKYGSNLLKIETKSGRYFRIARIDSHYKGLAHFLESAVYGRSV